LACADRATRKDLQTSGKRDGGALAPRAGRGLQPWRCVRCPVAAIINRSPALRISEADRRTGRRYASASKAATEGPVPLTARCNERDRPLCCTMRPWGLAPALRCANQGSDPSVTQRRGARATQGGGEAGDGGLRQTEDSGAVGRRRTRPDQTCPNNNDEGRPDKAPFAHNTDWICGPRMTDLCGRWDQPGVTRRGWPGVDSPAEASLPV
jgi:hypothetical protein